MEKDVKNEQQETVKQHHRMAAGAWIDGEQYEEQNSPTLPKANSDHGVPKNKGVDKSNA